MLFTKKKSSLLAVANGRAIHLANVPDEAFSTGLLGQGFAIDPNDGNIYSPIAGCLQTISESKHAYTIFSDDGLDLLIHIGIDSVVLKGEGFTPLCEAGDQLKAGDALAQVDLALLEARGIPRIIPVVITNPERLKDIDFAYGPTEGGKSEVMHYRLG